MQLLAFFGAIGGMKNFVGTILGTFGNYFSGKFFGSKLTSDLYIQKKRKSKNKKSNIVDINHEGESFKSTEDTNKLNVGEDYHKG